MANDIKYIENETGITTFETYTLYKSKVGRLGKEFDCFSVTLSVMFKNIDSNTVSKYSAIVLQGGKQYSLASKEIEENPIDFIANATQKDILNLLAKASSKDENAKRIFDYSNKMQETFCRS